MRKIFEQWGKCCLRFKRSAIYLFGLGKCCLRFKRNTINLLGWGKCYSKIKRTAFTLAEVLIVLSIIGIVAESTIPTLKAKVDKQVYVTQLKKFYTTQMEGWSRLLADEGVDKLDDTSVFQRMKSSGCGLSEVNSVNCKPFYDALKKYFRFSAIRSPNYQMTYLNRSKSYTYTGSVILIFSDGSILFNGSFYRSGITAAGRGHMTSMQAQFLYIDINGFKKPNMWGRDIFEFVLSGNGKI